MSSGARRKSPVRDAISITVEKPDDGPIKTGTLKLDDVGYYKDIKVFAVPQVAADQITSLDIKKGIARSTAIRTSRS